MVRGLDLFREWFASHADQYVLIGGTAAGLTMEDAGLAFRATKDLDIVLHVEALSPPLRGLLEIRRGGWIRDPSGQQYR